jgi:hypothetical protein
VDTYLRLNEKEERVFQSEVDKMGMTQKEAIMQATTSWEERGIEQGIEQERRSLVLVLLEQKIGQLSDTTRDRIASLSLDQLSTLAIALLNFDSVDDLNHWLDVNR